MVMHVISFEFDETILFLIQRGLAAGITIYAPSIILSTILGWSLNWLNFVIAKITKILALQNFLLLFLTKFYQHSVCAFRMQEDN